MESSSLDTETSSTIDIVLPVQLSAKGSSNLCRMGSGTSVVIDSVNGIETESRKPPSSKYKGVVTQPNGRWGAQIYEKHQRVWLGTFSDEDEAAKAYDIAAQRFRGHDAVTNTKPLSPDQDSEASELRFLNSKSKAEVVDMLRKHTYHDELQQSRRNLTLNIESCNRKTQTESEITLGNGMTRRNQLFEKVVTPSDVGKLNRLVIPKQHAEKHFPLDGKGVLLNFEDVDEKVWRFRYSYWNSSQSYVLTKGWSRFVKEKNLKAGDVVSFQRSCGPDKQLYIDWKSRSSLTCNGPGEQVLGQIVESTVLEVSPAQMIRLFGVDICECELLGNGKRLREVECLSMESSSKRQTVIIAL